MTITERFAEFVATLKLDDLPTEVVHRTKDLVLDLVGCAVRARHDCESTSALLAAIHAMGLTHGSAHVFADATTYSPAGAALLNAALAHSLDFDDTHAAAMMHPGAAVVPAALAAAEQMSSSGADLLTAIVAGYETSLNLALALPPDAHYARGFHPTATCGVFGAAAAAASVYRLTPSRIESALGIALSGSAGSLQFLNNGAWSKRFQVGWASMTGLMAAALAREGFLGASQAIEGRYGFLNAYSPSPLPARATETLGTVFQTIHTGVKAYPCCRWGHAAIEAALGLLGAKLFSLSQIEAITVGLSRPAMALIGEPADRKERPLTPVEAQFSGPFMVAVALLNEGVSWQSFLRLQEDKIQAMTARIHCEFDPAIQSRLPAMAARVTVRAAGRVHERLVEAPVGEADNFPSGTVLRTKFNSLIEGILSQSCASRLANAIYDMEELLNVAELFDGTSKREVRDA